MKFSEVDVEIVKEYANAYDEDSGLLKIILEGAKSRVKSYTGLSDDELDLHEDITIALLVICNEMFENRVYSADSSKANILISSILDSYSQNLL